MPTILKDVLDSANVRLTVTADKKEDIIRELVGILADNDLVRDRDEAEKVVLAREFQLSTGLHNGVAIPHGKSDTVSRLVAAIGIKAEGADFDSVDGEPSTIFIVTISPPRDTGPHIQFMSAISRLLLKPGVCDAILAAQTPEEIVERLTVDS